MGINSANSAFQSGVGAQPYTGSMVTPFAQQSTDAFKQMTDLANTAQPGMTAGYQGVANLAGLGGSNALQNEQIARLQPYASGNGLNTMQQTAYNRLDPTALGQNIGNNPYLNDVIARSSADITGANDLQASAYGRYGSGGHQAVTDKAIADMAAPLRYQDYQTQQQRSDQAIRDQLGIGTTGFGQQHAAIGDLYNAGQQQWKNITDLPGQLAAGYNTAMMPSQTLRTVGGEYEDLMSKQLTDQRRIFDEQQQQPWKQIGYLNQALSGVAPTSGTTTSQATAPGTSRLMAGLGGAMGGGELLGPWGALAGGLAGAFG
jgi:hypothetical protein